MSTEATDNESTFSLGIVRGILEGLKIQKASSDFADIIVVICDVEFKCHKVILAACSEFFRALLSSGMKESRERRVPLIGILPETFSDILDCMYTGKNVLNEQTMFDIWHAANQLQIHFLLSECEVFLKEKISTENCFAIYQSSKLLDFKDMTQFSWSYILLHFESVRRSDDILMLTESEMKQLIASQDLNTHSEDGVLETILRWIAYIPPEAASRYEYLDNNFETRQEYLQNSIDCSPESSENRVDVEKRDPQVQNVQEDKRGSEKKTVKRADQLCDLLKIAKICLLSGKCLMELMRNDFVSADKRAQEVLQEGFEYQLRTDRHHNFCPPSAITRSTSHVENVVVGIRRTNNYNDYILVCRKQDGQWCSLGKPMTNQYIITHSAVGFNHNVYVTVANQQIFVYITSTNTWKELPKLTVAANVKCILSIGNFLYAVHEDKCSSIEMINLTEAFDASYEKWISIGRLSLESMNITCTSIVGDKIIFFGSIPENSDTKVLIFDTLALACSQLNPFPPLSSVAVSFSKAQDSFVLLSSGGLYRIKASCVPPFLEIEYETLLWDFERILKGALLFNDELLLFGPSFSSYDSDIQWKLSVQGVFSSVKNIICSENYSCFMHAVIPKIFLTTHVNLPY